MKLFKCLMLALVAVLICPAALAQNLLTNPSFETWDAGLPTGWLAETLVTITQETTPVYEGTYSVGLAATTSTNAGIYQLAPVTTGTSYEYSVYINGVVAGSIGIYLNWLDSGGASISGVGTIYNLAAGSYELVTTGPIEAPVNAVNARCRIRAYANSTFGGYVDAASFIVAAPGPTATPEATATPGTPEPTATPNVLTIYDVQFTTDPSGDSPYNGQSVTVTGIVTAFQEGDRYMFIQDGAGGWNGILLYSPPGGWSGYNEGDELEVTATVDEYDGLTELSYCSISVLSVGNPLPAFTTLSTLAVNDEQYESVLCRVENVTVTDPNLGYGEWEINDGSGTVVVNDQFYAHVPLLNDIYGWVQGPVAHSFGAFKIEPRYASDIDATPAPTATPTATPSPAPTCGTEIIVNGDMELWSAGAGGPPNSWTSSNTGFTLTQDSVVFYDGDNSALMTKAVSGSQTMEQILTYEVNSEALYTLSVRVLDNDPDGYAKAWVVFYDATNTYISTSTLSQSSVDNTGWQELLTVSDSPADAVYGRVRVRVYNEDLNTNDVTINVDAASLIEECGSVPTSTPEGPTPTPTGGQPIPTTGPMGIGLLLLALGGLLSFSGRRRK